MVVAAARGIEGAEKLKAAIDQKRRIILLTGPASRKFFPDSGIADVVISPEVGGILAEREVPYKITDQKLEAEVPFQAPREPVRIKLELRIADYKKVKKAFISDEIELPADDARKGLGAARECPPCPSCPPRETSAGWSWLWGLAIPFVIGAAGGAAVGLGVAKWGAWRAARPAADRPDRGGRLHAQIEAVDQAELLPKGLGGAKELSVRIASEAQVLEHLRQFRTDVERAGGVLAESLKAIQASIDRLAAVPVGPAVGPPAGPVRAAAASSDPAESLCAETTARWRLGKADWGAARENLANHRARFFSLCDLAASLKDPFRNSYRFEESQAPEWLWVVAGRGEEFFASPADPSYYASPASCAILPRFFEIRGPLPRPDRGWRFKGLIRPCRLKRASSRNEYVVAELGVLETERTADAERLVSDIEIVRLRENVSRLEGELRASSETRSVLDRKIGEIEQELRALSGEVGKLKGTLASLLSREDFEELSRRLSALIGEVGALKIGRAESGKETVEAAVAEGARVDPAVGGAGWSEVPASVEPEKLEGSAMPAVTAERRSLGPAEITEAWRKVIPQTRDVKESTTQDEYVRRLEELEKGLEGVLSAMGGQTAVYHVLEKGGEELELHSGFFEPSAGRFVCRRCQGTTSQYQFAVGVMAPAEPCAYVVLPPMRIDKADFPGLLSLIESPPAEKEFRITTLDQPATLERLGGDRYRVRAKLRGS
jgi:hypothetical protein